MTPSIDIAERQGLISARIQSGQDTYAGRLDGWHRLGNVFGRFSTMDEITKAAGLDFDVFLSQLRDGLGRPVEAWGIFRWDHSAKEAQDASKARFLATVGKGYGIIPHQTGAPILDALVGRIEGAHYETAGSLDFGARVWYQINPAISIRVGEDESRILLTMVTSHDGSTSLEIFETGIRVVCKNTLRIATLKRLQAILRVKHTKHALSRMADLQASIEEMKDSALSMQDKLTYLASKRVTKESYQTIMNRVFPSSPESDSTQPSSRRANVLGQILAGFEDNDAGAFPEQAGTPYALLNAITAYTDHSRTTRAGERESSIARAESAVLGSGNALKSRALEIILEEAPKMPARIISGESIPWEATGLAIPREAVPAS
jgi:phage/plasmid-like protein (TIGR03299 family)